MKNDGGALCTQTISVPYQLLLQPKLLALSERTYHFDTTAVNDLNNDSVMGDNVALPDIQITLRVGFLFHPGS